MFHEITESQLKRRKRRGAIIACCIAAIVVATCIALSAAQANARTQGAVALRDAVLQSAKQCCAIEGSYPASLDYLEQNYGLTINHGDYVVSYEYFAGNVMPSVVVTPK